MSDKEPTPKELCIALFTREIKESFYDENRALHVTFHDGKVFSLDSEEALIRIIKEAYRKRLLLNMAVNRKSIRSWLYDYVNATTEQQCNAFNRVAITFAENTRDILNLYIKLNESEVIQVSKDNHTIIHDSKMNGQIRFSYNNNNLDIPKPQSGGSINMLKELINFANEDDFRLTLCYLIYCFFPGDYGAKPILIFEGEQGSGKSKASEFLKQIIDPHKHPLSTLQTSEDIMLSAKYDWVTVLDNLSNIKKEFSDILCKLATGGSFSKRKLFTDGTMHSTSFKKPLIINGINNLITREDFADRCILINLQTIKDRVGEMKLKEIFDESRPLIFGAICDILKQVIAILPSVSHNISTRMVEFARVGIAIEKALGWEEGEFLRIYDNNKQDVVHNTIENNALAKCIVGVLEDIKDCDEDKFFRSDSIYGSASDLLKIFQDYCKKNLYGSEQSLPKSPESLALTLKRLKPHLYKIGIMIIKNERTGFRRTYTIKKKLA